MSSRISKRRWHWWVEKSFFVERSGVVWVIGTGAGMAALLAVRALAAPPLPTQCTTSNCGTAAQKFVQYGSAAAALNGNTLNVNQASSKAVLNWANFNIANGYTVNFNQPGSTAAVLNNIWSADPSVIAGHLNANGQVYLYNQNGIVFDKGAQVDVGSLTASTLTFAPVANSQDPNALFENGILSGNVAGAQTPAPVFVAAPGTTPGTVQVNGGASLTAADGGRIILLGSAVTNRGSISTPDGQTILGAASNSVYLLASSDASLRGLLIEVDGGGTTGTVTNDGVISSPRGNITLAGLVVNQSGTLSATTSVGENGSIYLVAGDTSAGTGYYIANPQTPQGVTTAFGGLLPNNGGTLILSPGSITEVLPDPTDTGTITVAQLPSFVPSQVDLVGRAVALEGSASIHAPSANVNVYAAGDPYQLESQPGKPVADGGSIYLDKSSSIDVAGLSNVSVPVTRNLLQVTLETNDLQNDPLLRDGFLHGTTVTVNVSDPPTLFDITPYENNIGLNISQLSSTGGSIVLNATNQVITRSGSTLNVSGGSTAYQGAYGPSTTDLIASNGQVYNIANAPSDLQYVGVASGYSSTDPTWGVTTKGNAQTYYPSYLQGADAGSIEVESQQVYLRGSLLGNTVEGPYQRTQATSPEGGKLILGCSSCVNQDNSPSYGVAGGVSFANSLNDNAIGNVVVDGNIIGSVSLPSVSLLSPTELAQGGFNTIDIYSSGVVALPRGLTLALAPNGGFAVKSGQQIDIDGNIDAPGASVSLQTPSTGDLLPHDIDLGAGAVIDVSGTWTNDSPLVTTQPGTAPIVLNGGTVSVNAAGNVNLGAASLIDVSGGGWVNSGGKLSTGNGGGISLAASFSLDSTDPVNSPLTASVNIGRGVTLEGASLQSGGGGTLAVQSGSVTVGTVAQKTPGEMLLAPAFFTQGGFASYNITGQSGVIIGDPNDAADGATVTIAPLEQTLVFDRNDLLQPTGSSIGAFTQLATLPLPLRSAASVSFTASASDHAGGEIGDVTLARDAAIVTDPGASVKLDANGYNGNVLVFGSIDAPAGQITLQLLSPSNSIQGGSDPGFIGGQRIELGPDAVLAAPAFAEINTLDPLGYRQGSVLAGGTISLVANKGFVETDPGSLIDVSGAAGTLDVISAAGVVPTTVAGNAGTITLDAREGLVLQGNLLASAASQNGVPVAGAAGGTLNVSIGTNYTDSGTTGTGTQNSSSGIGYPTNTRVLTVAGTDASGAPAVPPSNQLESGTAVIDVSTIKAGGFDAVTLTSADEISFAGTVALQSKSSLVLDAPVFVGSRGAEVHLASAYVAVGNYLNNPDYFDTNYASPNASAVLNPTSGTAALVVNAQMLDIRGISGWSGFATENFNSSGDIRLVAGENAIFSPPSVNVPGAPGFEGALNTSGTLDLQAAQVYPTTFTAFAINDLPSSAAPSIAPSATLVEISTPAGVHTPPAIPLSAGGELFVNATNIDQNGVLRAPLGEIALNGVSLLDSTGNVLSNGKVTLGDGSVTSVSAAGAVIPYGVIANDSQWTYSSAAGYTNVLTQPPAKQITLNASDVSVNSGAKIDLSGGGDLYAYEFIAGQGGSVDVLDQASLTSASRAAGTPVYSYAIVPTLASPFTPIDAQYGQSSTVGPNQTIYISGVPGLAAGTYALLPAHYALLPGAYAVEVTANNSAILPGTATEQPDGSYIAAARFGIAGTDILSSLTSTVLIAPSATVRAESQYTDTYANAFFSAAAASAHTAAPSLPADAGQLVLSAGAALSLGGSINFATGSFTSGTTASGAPITQQGLGGDVAITAQNIVVVNSTASQAAAAAGVVELNVQQLDDLNAQTLILGASRTETAAGEQISVGSTQTVELKNTTALTAPEIILAAQSSVTVDPGAQLAAIGSSTQTASSLVLSGGSALLRVSSAAGATLSVDSVPQTANSAGTVTIDAGANVKGSGSLLLYGTTNTVLASGAEIAAPAVALYSSQVSLGNAPQGTPGLVLTADLLGKLQGLRDLTLGSSSTIDFYGAVQLGTSSSSGPSLESISLDAGGLGGYGAGDKVLEAGSITIQNSSGTAANFATVPNGSGALQVVALAGTNSPSGQLILGAGSKTISGFSGVELHADGDIIGTGSGTLSVASSGAVPVTLSSAALVGDAGSNQTLTTSGAVTITSTPINGKLTLPAPGLGAEWDIQGSTIAQNGAIEAPAGIITLDATNGGVSLGKGSVTSAAGAYQNYTVTEAAAAGGQINLTAAAGNVAIGEGAIVDVSGASPPAGATGSAAAGSLSISAPLGTFLFAGSTIKGGAAQGEGQGNFSLDVGSGLAGTGFATLEAMLSGSGFAGDIDLRTRNDAAVVVTGNVRAASFELSADSGTIEIAGSTTINTSGGAGVGSDGGAIAFWAGNGLSVDAGAQLLANAGSAGPVGANGAALASTGGDITLGTVAGSIEISGGTAQRPTLISMSGTGGADTDGYLTLRAPRTIDDADVQIQIQSPASVEIASRNPVVVEGVKVYSATDLGSVDSSCGFAGSCDVADLNGMLFTDAAAFLLNSSAITARLGLPNVEVRPGIEVDSPGDLILDNSTTAWDLASWNAALGAPVNLTLRAAGNLIFETSLSDGFTNNGSGVAFWTLGESGTALDSASYRITGGADLSAANPLAVVAQAVSASSLGAPPNSGNVVLTSNNVIRTGTGNIEIAAGGDVLIGYSAGDASGNLYDNGVLQVAEVDPQSSAIYTAGLPSALTAAQAALFALPRLPGTGGQVASYPTGGGNVSISAADDIRSAISGQLVSDWLWRRAPTNGVFSPAANTSWWIMFGDFDQGVGVLGGGNLTLTAGRDIVNTSAVIPTTGRLLVGTGGTPAASDLLLTGGGNLRIQAGGDIISGVYEDDWGNASISAGGALTSSSDSTFGQETANYTAQAVGALPAAGTEIYPILVVGNGVFDVSARAGISLQSVTNSTTLPLSEVNENIVGARGQDGVFYTYAASANPSTLNLISAGGDVYLDKDGVANLPIVAYAGAAYADEPLDYLSVYPSTVNVAALSGNIDLGDPALEQVTVNGVNISLFPSSMGNLTLLAYGAINNDGLSYSINVSESNPALAPSALAPAGMFQGISNLPLPQVPLFQNSTVPISIVADTGDIASGTMIFPKAANVIAGGDISDVTFSGKNLSASDVTLISAGGNIEYSTPTQPITDLLQENGRQITLGGPGYLEVLAGGSINLGDSSGIVTTGSLTDSRLPTNGAAVVVGAGFGANSSGGLRQPAYQSFINTYLAPSASGTPSAYAAALIGYVQQLDPAASAKLGYSAALAAFKALSPAQQLPLLAQVLSDELSATGLAHTLQGTSYTRGYTAINTLFPTVDGHGNPLTYSGDIDMFYSQIKTEEGGDIDLLAPGGSVVVGVANPPASLSTVKEYMTATGQEVPADVNLGVLVLGQGAIQGFVDQSFEVNQSRMLTLEGGDIILWASNGNIDAGKGAKSASGAPPPVISTDANGNLFVNPSNSVSGSGIGQLLTSPGIKPGLVNLIAPKGDVNAGDAGIRVAGNLNIAAVQVIGASNITVAGTATGVPVSEAGAFAGALSGANTLGDTSKNAVEQLSQDIGSSTNYQQMTDSLQTSFIAVKLFCLGVECEVH
jgi:filamentous hemagglutinin